MGGVVEESFEVTVPLLSLLALIVPLSCGVH